MTVRWGLHRHELSVDAIGDVSDREVRLPPSAVVCTLAGQAGSPATSQIGWHKVRLSQVVAPLASVGSVAHLSGGGRRQLGSSLNRCGLGGDERRRYRIELRQELAHRAAFIGAIVFPLEPVADHARSNCWRSVSGGAQRTFSRMVRSAQRTVRVLGVEPRVVRRPFRGQDDELRRNIRPKGHLDPPLTGLVSQHARHASEGAASPRVDCAVCGFSLSGGPASAVPVDAAPELPGSRFVTTCDVSTGQQRSTVSANPGAPAHGAIFIHATQSTVKWPGPSTELPRAAGDGLALPWYSGKHSKHPTAGGEQQ